MKYINIFLLLLSVNNVFAADTNNHDDNTNNHDDDDTNNRDDEDNPHIIAPAHNILPLDVRSLYNVINNIPADQLHDIVRHLIAALSNPAFITDNEDSVYYPVITCIDKMNLSDEDKRRLLDTVKWDQITPDYLRTVVLQTLPVELFNYCQEKTTVITNPRSKYANHNKMMIRCVFNEVKTWGLLGKYYSSPVLLRGYMFHYFLQANQLPDGNHALVGFLRCQGPANATDLYLPLEYSVTIVNATGLPREFAPMKVIFTHKERAIGGKLTIGDERWENTIIIGDDNHIVNNGKIYVILKIKFIDPEEVNPASFFAEGRASG